MSCSTPGDVDPLPSREDLVELRRDIATRGIGCLWVGASLGAYLLLGLAGWVGASELVLIVLFLCLFAPLAVGVLLLILGGKPWLLRPSVALSTLFASAAVLYLILTPVSDAGRQTVVGIAGLAALAGGASVSFLPRRRSPR